MKIKVTRTRVESCIVEEDLDEDADQAEAEDQALDSVRESFENHSHVEEWTLEEESFEVEPA